jgi:hypothetical protein
MPTVFSTALMDRRLSLAVNAHGDITGVSATPPLVFGFSPALLVGRNLAHCLDVFTGLPATGAPQRLDMEHVLAELVHRRVCARACVCVRAAVHSHMACMLLAVTGGARTGRRVARRTHVCMHTRPVAVQNAGAQGQQLAVRAAPASHARRGGGRQGALPSVQPTAAMALPWHVHPPWRQRPAQCWAVPLPVHAVRRADQP